MSIQQIVTLLEFCPKNTYFLFQGKYYEEVHGAAMGSPISPLIANLFMEEFEVEALSSALHPALMAKVCGLTLLSSRRQNTANHYYDTSTHRTHAYNSPWRNQTKRELYHSLDTLVSPGPNNTLITTVYRKPTHTEQYLQWDRNHFMTAKSVFNTLAHRAKVVYTNQEAIYKEMEHI